MAQLVEHRAALREVDSGGTNTQELKITRGESDAFAIAF